MRATTLRRWNLVLLAGYVGACIVAFPHLPERIPLHFGFGGGADAWARTSGGAWFLLPVLGAAVILFGYAVSRVAAHTPEMWSHLSAQEAKRVRALPSHVRAELYEAGQRATARALILVTVTFMGLQLGIYATAVERTNQMPWYAEVLIWGPLAALLLLSLRDGPRLRKQVRSTLAGAQGDRGTDPPSRA